jgi:hypothetical protein
VPVRQTVTVGFTGSFVVNVTFALRGPTAEGSNVIVYDADVAGATVLAVVGEIVKSPAFVPEIAGVAAMVSGWPPVLAIVIVAVPVTAPAATTLPALAHPVAGAVTLADGGGGSTHGLAPGGPMVTSAAADGQPVVTFVKTTGKDALPSCVPVIGPTVQAIVGNDVAGRLGTTTLNVCVPVPTVIVVGVTTAG